MVIECNCPKNKCERHGDCEKCEAYHNGKKRPPYCKKEKGLLKTKMNIDK